MTETHGSVSTVVGNIQECSVAANSRLELEHIELNIKEQQEQHMAVSNRWLSSC